MAAGSKSKDETRGSSACALACEEAEVATQSADRNVVCIARSFVHHGLASEAALHGFRPKRIHPRPFAVVLSALGCATPLCELGVLAVETKYESRNLRFRRSRASFGSGLFKTWSSSDDGDTGPQKGGSRELGGANAGSNRGNLCRSGRIWRADRVGGFRESRWNRLSNWLARPISKERL